MHCYRILGSVQDAEDLLQETLLSAWQALDRFDGRSLRAWLYRIATNRCLNYLRDTSRRPKVTNMPEFSGASPSDEPWWLEPYPDALMDDIALAPEARYDARESIALSFVSGLQRLPTQQRAALVLRDVMGFSASEIAEMLDSTPASVNSALQRARGELNNLEPPDSVPHARSEHEARVVDQFVESFQRGDLEGVIALLSEDAKFTMPPEPVEFRGPRAIAEFLRSRGFWVRASTGSHQSEQPTRLRLYLPDPNANIHRASGNLVLSVRADRISAMTRFGDRSLLARFGLPRTMPSD